MRLDTACTWRKSDPDSIERSFTANAVRLATVKQNTELAAERIEEVNRLAQDNDRLLREIDEETAARACMADRVDQILAEKQRTIDDLDRQIAYLKGEVAKPRMSS